MAGDHVDPYAAVGAWDIQRSDPCWAGRELEFCSEGGRHRGLRRGARREPGGLSVRTWHGESGASRLFLARRRQLVPGHGAGADAARPHHRYLSLEPASHLPAPS